MQTCTAWGEASEPLRSSREEKHATDIRKTVALAEKINSEYGARANPPLRRVALAAVFKNPLAGRPAGAG